MDTNNEKRPRGSSHGLGRGLGALLGDDFPAAASESVSPVSTVSPAAEEVGESGGGIRQLRVSDIEPNPHQPRTDFDEASLQTLAESIRDNGLLQPLVVRPKGSRYQLIAGERRWRACRRAGLSRVPAIVMDADELKMTELALIENLQREDLNPLEEARSYRLLTEDFGLSQAEAAARVGKSRPAVANALRLLSLPEAVQELVRTGTLSAGHARALLSLEDEGLMEKLAEKVVQEELNVRQTERLAAAWNAGKVPAAAEAEVSGTVTEADVDHLAESRKRLSGLWGRRVDFREARGRRFVTLEYYDNEDLSALIEALEKLRPQGL